MRMKPLTRVEAFIGGCLQLFTITFDESNREASYRFGIAVKYLTRFGHVSDACSLFNYDTIISYHLFYLIQNLVEYLLSKPETNLIDRATRIGKPAAPTKFDLDQEEPRPSFLIAIKEAGTTSCG